MIIKRGDRVKFLNDTGGGIVTKIKDSKMALVLIDDGFEVPVLITELIPVSGKFGAYGASGYGDKSDNDGYSTGSQSADKGSAFQKNQIARSSQDEESENYGQGNYAGKPASEMADDNFTEFMPDEESDIVVPGFEDTCFNSMEESHSDQHPSGEKPARHKPERNMLLGLVESSDKKTLDVWLINDSRFNVLYSVLQKVESSFLNIRTGHIEPDTKILIRQFSREQINSFIILRLEALFFTKGLFDAVSPSQAEFNMDPVEIYSDGNLSSNDFFDEDAMIVHLISDPHDREVKKIREQDVSRLLTREKDVSLRGSGTERPKADPLVEEVDLHIEDLVEDHGSLSGREVLDIQMARFTTALEGALLSKTKRIVFIHGVGNGKLKFEIRKTLDKKYPRLRYQDASFKEYGYGATMVIIRK